jgi:hypothetical protein
MLMNNGNIKILTSEYGSFRKEIRNRFRKNVLKNPSIILDPMAGTAPLIPFFEKNGHTAFLNDILPIHFFINKAKRYQVFQQYKQLGYNWYFQQLMSCMASLQDKELTMSDKWIEDSILNGLIEAWKTIEQYEENSATFLKAAILLCVRPLSSITTSRNPTWLKYGGVSSAKPLIEIIRDSLNRFEKYYNHNYKSQLENEGKCVITKHNATELKLPQEVDFILTSPPYCNRLDPLVQYGPENYFLFKVGYNIPEDELVTSTRVRNYDTLEKDFEFLVNKSKTARALLTKIRDSPNRDDPGYYLKYYTRYFAKLFRVIESASKNLSASGKIYMVTQDNTHRGQLINIDGILRELLKASGWHSRVIEDWDRHHQGLRNISRNHAFVRPKQKEYLRMLWR